MAGYNGTIELISGIKPKNDGNFPLVHAKDVQIMDDGTRLSEVLNNDVFPLQDISVSSVNDAFNYTVPAEHIFTLTHGRVYMVEFNDAWYKCETKLLNNVETCVYIGNLDIINKALGLEVSAVAEVDASEIGYSKLDTPTIRLEDSTKLNTPVIRLEDGFKLGTPTIRLETDAEEPGGTDDPSTDNTEIPFAVLDMKIGNTTPNILTTIAGTHKIRIYSLGLNSLPTVSQSDNGKILQVVKGDWAIVKLEDSYVKTYIDNYIASALGGDY